jgi:DNA-binding LytR/AlgR family response regulator
MTGIEVWDQYCHLPADKRRASVYFIIFTKNNLTTHQNSFSMNEVKFNCLIVDDNKIARVLLTELLKQVPSVNIAGECSGAAEATGFIAANKVDILLLDIEMPDMNGFELLKALASRPVTILTSANKGYAEEAYELNVVDYLVKPVGLPRLMMAISRAAELLKEKDAYLNTIEQEHIFIKEGKAIRKLLLDDIYWIESKGDYVKIFTANKSHIVHASLKQLEERLPSLQFIRVHRSYMIALNKIDYMEDNVLYLNNTPVPVSENNKPDLLKRMNLI